MGGNGRKRSPLPLVAPARGRDRQDVLQQAECAAATAGSPATRACIAAPPGRVLVKADYSQIELRIAAKIAGEKQMLAAYVRGEDLHVQTARLLLGRETVTKADRQLAKALNFGLLYGMGAERFRSYAQSEYRLTLTPALRRTDTVPRSSAAIQGCGPGTRASRRRALRPAPCWPAPTGRGAVHRES